MAFTYSFPDLEPVCHSMPRSNCCFLTCIQISQDAGQVLWYSHLFKNFPQFVVVHTVKGFGIVNKAEVDVFLELSCFFDDPMDAGNLMSGSSAFSKSSLNIWKFFVHLLLNTGLKNFEHYFASVWDECDCVIVWTFFGITFLWDWMLPYLGIKIKLTSKSRFTLFQQTWMNYPWSSHYHGRPSPGEQFSDVQLKSKLTQGAS